MFEYTKVYSIERNPILSLNISVGRSIDFSKHSMLSTNKIKRYCIAEIVSFFFWEKNAFGLFFPR